MQVTNINRYQAFAIHLVISLILFLIILLCLTQYWYPGILFDTGNGWKAIGIIIGIDLILGPLLTILVFNPVKKSLRFDLTIIGMVQISALIYGSWTIYSSRPVALAFINNSFATIYANAELGLPVNELARTHNTLTFFYDFDSIPANSQALLREGFKPYTLHKDKVAAINSPYMHQKEVKGQKVIYIELDPLASRGRFIAIDESGRILYFSKSLSQSTN
jgi:hypothetical protein